MPLKLYQRNQIWHFRGTVAGRRLRGSCKTTDKAIAARQIAEIEAKQWKCGFDGPQAVLTFAQAALAYRAAGKSDRFLPPIEDYFKDTLVKDITPGSIRQMAIALFSHCSGASRNRMGILPAQAIINHAAELELCQRIRVKRFKEETKIKEPATLEWVEVFRSHASPQLGAFALFMFLTGARPSEALTVQWSDVDLKAGSVIIRQSKVSSERKAHLPEMLVAAMANIPKMKDRPVFLYRCYDDVHGVWKSVIKRAGIQRLTPHCCRHGFATELLRNGVDVFTVAWLGGWKGPAQVIKTYGHAIKNAKLTDVLTGTKSTQQHTKFARNASKTSTS